MLEYLDGLTLKLLSILIILVAIIILTCGPLWNVYFIKKARLNYKVYMKYLKLARTDSTNMYAQWAYCCRTEFNKYILLLSINITECGGTVLYCIAYGLGEWLHNTHQSFMFPHRAETHNCSQILLQGSNLQMYWITEIPFGLFLVSIGQVGCIFSMVLSICLMKYIHAREYNRSSDYKVWNKRYLMIMVLIAMCTIVLGTVPQFVLVQRTIELIVQIIVYFKWVRQARRLMIGSYFVTVSILFFANKFTNGFNRHRRTRFTPDLYNPLLIQPETTNNNKSCNACSLICI